MSIVSLTINKYFLIIILSCSSFACSNRVQEFDRQCQSGWEAQSNFSNIIYNKLSQYNYTSYISIKEGNDRGNYNFYFIGQSNSSGLFLHANKSKIMIRSIPLSEVEMAFSFLPQETQTLDGYTGKGETWSHLACSYMEINKPRYTKTLSFHDYILMHSQASSSSRLGVSTFLKIKKYFDGRLLGSDLAIENDLNSINAENTSNMDAKVILDVNARKQNKPLFYEIP